MWWRGGDRARRWGAGVGGLAPGINSYYHQICKESEAAVSDTTLTSKGQTTIPKGIRDELGIRPGDRMTFTLLPDGTVIMRVKNRRLADAAGSLHR